MNNTQIQEATKSAVKQRFHGHQTLRGKTVQRYPDTAEREMKRLTNALMNISKEELRKSLPEIMREYKSLQRGDSRLDGIGDFSKMIRKIFQDIAIAISDRVESLHLVERVEAVSAMTRNNAIREWKRTVKETLGIDIFSDYYKAGFYDEFVRKWIDDNVALIKSIPSNSLDEMREIILNGYSNGKTVTAVQKEIQEEYGVSKSKARMLARDQISTLNAEITQAQQRDAGVTHYKWSTSLDARVRDCHAELEGKIISWDDPPEMWYDTKKSGRIYTGRRCHPGEDYCCRCCAIPVFNYETISLPVSGSGKGG